MKAKLDDVIETADAPPAPKKKAGRPYKPKFIEQAVAAVADAATLDGKPLTKAEQHEYAPDGVLTDIWERRLLNPDGIRSLPIRIKTPGMRLRWINLTNTGRYQRARHEQGWVPVQRTELVDEREIHGVGFTPEGYVCRGEKQGEMLMKMPEAIFKGIQKRRRQLNEKSYQNIRDNISSSGAKHFSDKYGRSAGDQAADSMSGFKGSIKFGSEKATTDELLED